MNKQIILLSGSPESKNALLQEAQKTCWTWNVNPKNFLANEFLNDVRGNKLFWSGERNSDYYKFLGRLSTLANDCFDFEEKYLKEKIQAFLDDESEYKERDGVRYQNFLLIIHGVNKHLVNMLKNEYGALRVVIVEDSTVFYNQDGIEKILPDNVDFVLKETDSFENFVRNLTKG